MCFGICGNRDTLFDIFLVRNYLCFTWKYIGDICCMEDIQKYSFKTFMNFSSSERSIYHIAANCPFPYPLPVLRQFRINIKIILVSGYILVFQHRKINDCFHYPPFFLNFNPICAKWLFQVFFGLFTAISLLRRIRFTMKGTKQFQSILYTAHRLHFQHKPRLQSARQMHKWVQDCKFGRSAV